MKRKAKMRETLIYVVCAAGLVGVGVTPSGIAIADENLSDGLMQCSLIEESSERLICFDNLVGRNANAKATHPTTVQAEIAQEATPETPIQKAQDDLGAENLPSGARGDVDKLAVRALVTSCKKNSVGKYFFIFDNGHVWKQTSSKKLRFTKCEFEVTITKDVFGYKMQQLGDGSKIRIARVR